MSFNILKSLSENAQKEKLATVSIQLGDENKIIQISECKLQFLEKLLEEELFDSMEELLGRLEHGS